MTRRFVAIVAAGAVGLVGCAQDSGGGGGSGKDVTIRVATTDAVSSLDPAGAYDVGSRTVLANLYQTLLTIIPGKSTPVPDAAECQFDQPTTYTCTLRTSSTFHNGHQLRASDVKFSFERLRRIKEARGPAGLFTSLGTIDVPDEFTVVFNLKRADATFPYLLTTTAAAIVDEEVFPPAKVLANAKAVGSGPYRLADYKPAQITLDKFTGYKGVRPPRNSKVVIGYHKQSAWVARLLKGGAADVGFRALGPAEVKQLRSNQGLQVVEGDAAEIRMWAFHYYGVPAARKLAVRRAVAQLVDREAIVRKAYDGQVTPLYSLMPTGFGGHAAAFRNEYRGPDKVKAADILRGAGVVAPVPLTVAWTPSHFGPGAGVEAAELKRQLDASGLFRVTLVRAEWPVYWRQARAGAYHLYHFGWIPDFPDGDNFLSPFLREGGYYSNGYKSGVANRLLDLEVGSQNQVDRDATFRDLQTVVANDVPVLPIWQGRMVVVAGKGVDGVKDTLNPLFYFYFSYLTK